MDLALGCQYLHQHLNMGVKGIDIRRSDAGEASEQATDNRKKNVTANENVAPSNYALAA